MEQSEMMIYFSLSVLLNPGSQNPNRVRHSVLARCKLDAFRAIEQKYSKTYPFFKIIDILDACVANKADMNSNDVLRYTPEKKEALEA